MDSESKTPRAEILRQMPYSELKKIAKQHGLKGKLKAEKIIAALTSAESDDTDYFSTPAAKLMNSSTKRKTEKFDEDSMTPLVTPRRGTYSVGSPIALKQNEISPPSIANELSVHDLSNVTIGRGSERKLRSHKQNEASPFSVMNESSVLDQSNVTASINNESFVFDVSNITTGKVSERKSRGRKVSFLSPVLTPRTPRNSNLRMRPKTPIVSKTPLAAAISLSPMKEVKVNLAEHVDISKPLTPFSKKTSDESNKRSTSLLMNDASVKKKSISTPKLTRSVANKIELAKKKRLATPNFKKIHEKAFEKMESIDDYQKRIVNSGKKMGAFNFKANKVTKAKSKIPAFGGIPFIPSVSKSNPIKRETYTNATKWEASTTMNKSRQLEGKRKPLKKDAENISSQRKKKFDLKASLSKKLGYKPYSGPLKPLTPSNLLNTSNIACTHKNKDTPAKPINKVVASNRMQSRSMLKGVRTNKRFELQMKNRMLQ